ncbi:unnamed protein product, partial [Pylaiella littoralis]
DSPCAGDTSVAMCGGDNAFDLYQLFYDGPDGTVITADGSIAGTAAAIIERVKADFERQEAEEAPSPVAMGSAAVSEQEAVTHTRSM